MSDSAREAAPREHAGWCCAGHHELTTVTYPPAPDAEAGRRFYFAPDEQAHWERIAAEAEAEGGAVLIDGSRLLAALHQLGHWYDMAAVVHQPDCPNAPNDALDAARAEAGRLRLTLEAIGAELRARYEQSERDDSELRGAVWGLLASVRAALSGPVAAGQEEE